MWTRKGERRKNYFIDKHFQAAFIVKFCVVIICASVLTGMLTYYFNRQTTTVAFDKLRVVVKTTADFLVPVTATILVIVTSLAAVSTILVTLFASHKIAGPLYKLKMELDKIRKRDLRSAIRIRSRDQLQDVVTEFDAMRIEYKESIGSVKSAWAAIYPALDGYLKGVRDQGEKSEFVKNVKKIDSELVKYKT